MAEVLSRLWTPEAGIIAGFHAFIIVMLALDLGVFQRRSHAVSMREAAVWSVVWVSLALLFALGISRFWFLWSPDHAAQGPAKAMEFVTGYLIEVALSVDNLFVFLVIFKFFAVPERFRHRVLFWGILGAVLMRATFILAGAALLHYFHWLIYGFAVLLIYTGYKLTHSVEEDIDPGRNPLLRLARRFLPVVDNYDSSRFWTVRHEGRLHVTPLPLVLLVVESTDVLFAIDSIPAIFGVTRDPFIVYTSNIFAVIGLRSFYFLLSNFLGMFRYLNLGLAFVLVFVGIKMILEEWIKPVETYGIDKKYLVLASLGIVATILGIAIVASILAGPADKAEEAPAENVAAGDRPAGTVEQ